MHRKLFAGLLVVVAAVGSPAANAEMPDISDRTPEFARGGGACAQFGKVDFGRVSEQARNAASDVFVRFLMRRCVLEGVPVTSAEEVRIAPLIRRLTSAMPQALMSDTSLRAAYNDFLSGVRPILQQGFNGERYRRVETNVAAAMVPSSRAAASTVSQMLSSPQRQGGIEYYQPEFTRGPGCTVFGDASDDPGASREAIAATNRAIMQSVFRRCLLEGVSLTAAEDNALFPALRNVAKGPGARQYAAFRAAAERVLDPARAQRVAANVAEAQRRRAR